jgi:cell division protein FtsB
MVTPEDSNKNLLDAWTKLGETILKLKAELKALKERNESLEPKVDNQVVKN